jgi:hypothetical protein
MKTFSEIIPLLCKGRKFRFDSEEDERESFPKGVYIQLRTDTKRTFPELEMYRETKTLNRPARYYHNLTEIQLFEPGWTEYFEPDERRPEPVGNTCGNCHFKKYVEQLPHCTKYGIMVKFNMRCKQCIADLGTAKKR